MYSKYLHPAADIAAGTPKGGTSVAVRAPCEDVAEHDTNGNHVSMVRLFMCMPMLRLRLRFRLRPRLRFRLRCRLRCRLRLRLRLQFRLRLLLRCRLMLRLRFGLRFRPLHHRGLENICVLCS